MHRPTGDVAAKAEGTWSVGDKGQRLGLSWVGFDGNVIVVDVDAVNHVRADEAQGYGIAWVDEEFGGRIGILVRVNLKGPRLRRNGWNWQWRECYHQSSHCKEE